jgi:hypothetical protein
VTGAGTLKAASSADDRSASGSQAVIMLQLFALALMVIPSDTVILSIGAEGYPAALVGMFMFAVLAVSTLLGLHRRRRPRNPISIVLCLLWLSVLASYVLMNRNTLTVTEMASADRLLMQLTVITGVALVAAEYLESVADMRRVLRVLCWGGAFCGVVAALQYWLSLDISTSLRELPGFSVNGSDPAILTRGALNRVSGTAVYPIELGVVAGMLLPLAIYLGFHDTGRSAARRWTPAALIALGVPASVSRSAVLAFVVALAVLIVLMPVRQRVIAFLAMPLTLVAVFMTAPGLIGTLATFFGAGASDASVQSRLSDYPMVERFLAEAPWFGRGGWTYIAPNAFDVLDNQYLKTAVELGLVGVLALVVFFIAPAIAALSARRHSVDPELRFLCAALAGAALAAAVCSLTFDSLSYPMFIGVYSLIIGLIGAGWRLAVGAEARAGTRAELALAGPVPGAQPILRAGG